jgi:hypothetical protein
MANQGRSGAAARSAQRAAQRVAQQKVNTTNLLTPGTELTGLRGSNNTPFDGITDTLDGVPVIRVSNSGFQQMGRGVSKGGLPKNIQYAGTTLYGLKQGDDILYRAKKETPLMKTIKTKEKPPEGGGDGGGGLGDPPSSGPRLDPNATEQYASNFKAGEANKDAMQDYFKGQKNGENLAKWAEANPALAYKAYTKGVAKEQAQDQRDLMSDYRVMNQDVSKGEDFNKAEFDAIHGGKGGSVEVDIDGSGIGAAKINPQGFKDDAMTALLTNFGNTDVEPFVKDMALPTTTNYAGAFNQTDVPDLQSMMNMGEQLGNLGYEGPSFSQSFKDRFQNMMLGK